MGIPSGRIGPPTAVFVFALSLIADSFQQQNPPTTPQQDQQTPNQNPAAGGHLEQLQNSLSKLIYQLHGDMSSTVAPLSVSPQNPLSFPGIARHGDGFRTLSAAGAHPLVPLGPPALFPSSLLVPTPAHLPPTFRLPATVMAQHKAFPMDGSPPNPAMLVYSSIVEQPKRAKNESENGNSINNGTEQPIASQQPLEAMPNTVPESLIADEEGKDENSENALREAPPSAIPIGADGGNGTIIVENGPEIISSSSTTATPTSRTREEQQTSTQGTTDGSPQSLGQQIFLVPGGGGGANNNETSGNNSSTGNGAAAVDLEAFLHAANLSEQDTKMFLGLVERVLEEEVNRRLEDRHQQNNNRSSAGEVQRKRQNNIAVRTDGRQIVLELPRNGALDGALPNKQGDDQLLEQELEERLRQSQKELKTANTRLFSLASGEQEPQAGDGAVQQQQKGVTNVKTEAAISKSSVASKIRTGLEGSSADYKQREQADFDRLLDRLRAEEGGGGDAEGGDADADLLLIVPPAPRDRGPASTATTTSPTTTAISTTTPAATTAAASSTTSTTAASAGGGGGNMMMMNRQHNFWSRHGPRTKFERLVEDYRFRLNGQNSANGLNDLIKALRNAHIGLFDRNPEAVKILRRID